MNLKTLDKLEFNKICSKLENFAITYLGKEYSINLKPLSNKNEIVNEDVRKAARIADVPMWKVAMVMGVSEPTMSCWMRTELPEEKRTAILEAIEKNPESPAVNAKKMLMDILEFYNKDMYNQ